MVDLVPLKKMFDKVTESDMGPVYGSKNKDSNQR